MKDLEANLNFLYKLINEEVYQLDADKITPQMIEEFKPHLKEVMEVQCKDQTLLELAEEEPYFAKVKMAEIVTTAQEKMSAEKAGYKLPHLNRYQNWGTIPVGGGELGIHSVHDTNGQGKLRNLRRYSNEVTSGTIDNIEYVRRGRREFSVIESNPDMYMLDKANALMSIIDEVAHVDIALGLKGEDRLSYQLLTTDNRNKRLVGHVTPSHEYQESIACAMNQSHNNKPRVNH